MLSPWAEARRGPNDGGVKDLFHITLDSTLDTLRSPIYTF